MNDFKFTIKQRVKFYETDLQGVMHHSEFFRYFETARVEYMRHLKLIENGDFIGKSTVTVVETKGNFLKPLKFDDLFEIHIKISELKNASMLFEYMITKQNNLEKIATGWTRVAAIDKQNYKPTKIPKVMKEKISLFEKI